MVRDEVPGATADTAIIATASAGRNCKFSKVPTHSGQLINPHNFTGPQQMGARQTGSGNCGHDSQNKAEAPPAGHCKFHHAASAT